VRHPSILNRKRTALLLVDIQERVHAVMHFRDQVEANAIKLIRGFRILHVPIFITEQYPKGLGPTLAAVTEALGDQAPLQKMSFSCCGSEELMAGLSNRSVEQVAISGIETHVCVLQTALDLLASGFQVHVVRDAVSSRRVTDHETAIERMRAAGAIVTTTESTLFELMERADISEFKTVSTLIK